MLDRFRVEPNWWAMTHEEGRPQDEIERLMEEWEEKNQDDLLGEVACCVAGEVAERIAFGAAEEGGLAADRKQNGDLMWKSGPDLDGHAELGDGAYALAGKLLGEHWPGVLALAAALEERKTLTGAEAEAIFRASRTATTAR